MIRERIRGFGRIGVLMGGPSSEREISLRSGSAVYSALKDAGYNVVAIDTVGDVAEKIKEAQIAVAFIALHGKFGEDGTIQAILEDMNIPYTGSGPLASRLALDKIASRRIFEAQGLKVPKYMVLSSSDGFPSRRIEYPVVVKPATSGSSIGLSVVKDENGLTHALNFALQHDDWIILEEYINGREVTVGILDDEPMPVIEIVPKNKIFDYHAKYTPNATEYIVPAKLDGETYIACQRAGQLAHRSLGLRTFSRVDIIIDKENLPIVLEVNSIPGLTATSLLPKAAKATGIEFLELCERSIYSAITSDAKDKNSSAKEGVQL